MPRISPITERLRDTVIESIDRLLVAGKAPNIKAAARIIWTKSRQKHQITGFGAKTFGAFYWSVVRWYRQCKNSDPE